MDNKTIKTIQESKKWTAEDIENLSESILLDNTIGKNNYQLNEDITPTEYFTSLGAELNYFPREL